MGQYFTPTFLSSDRRIVAALDPADYGSGNKLYGHTRADTPLMAAVQTLLSLDGGLRLAWAGDYADNEPGVDTNLFFLIEDKHFVRFGGLVCDAVDPNRAMPATNLGTAGYVCNLDKQQYIADAALRTDFDGHRRTPLPLLTAEYGDADADAARSAYGSWARDRICYTHTAPPAGWAAVPAGSDG
ncbi:MAG: hypothetical protein CK429_05400 [Mycobacterium sp.]|nr:MAG: hypothetical protein CK429_05400 [Mycobacterium sp.]